jgi:hypothetical protein
MEKNQELTCCQERAWAGGEERTGSLPMEGDTADDYKSGIHRGSHRSGGAHGGGLDPEARGGGPARRRAEPPPRGAGGEEEILAA